MKSVYRSDFCALLLTLLTAISCGKDQSTTPNSGPFLTIENGQFDINAIVVDETDTGTGSRGSGSLSFNFTGDDSGSFSASGSLSIGQAQPGVGAVVTLIEGTELPTFEEVLTIVAFNPIGNGKADVLVLGSTTPVDSLTPGLFYPIGPFGLFTTAIFAEGINIVDFWTGQVNVLQAADRGFELRAGGLVISTRNGGHITGSFSAATQSSISKVGSTAARPWFP